MLQLAWEMKVGLNELMDWDGPLTRQQLDIWERWLVDRWNEPDRTDHYLMQIAGAFAKQGTAWEDLKLPFKTWEEIQDECRVTPAEREEERKRVEAAAIQAEAMARAGGPVTMKTRTRTEARKIRGEE